MDTSATLPLTSISFPKQLKRTQRSSTIRHTWGFREHWRSQHYHTGDLYQDELQEYWSDVWKAENPGPYHQFVRDISAEWPHLQGLADFMDVGTEPLRWRDFHGAEKAKKDEDRYTYPDDQGKRKKAQKKRVRRTNVAQIAYFTDGTCKSVGAYTEPEDLGKALDNLPRGATGKMGGKKVELRLFVVEDLSREVIERLGYTFDIDPEFFRAHAFDYVWFNIRDPFWEPPGLHVDVVRRDWYQFRFCRARYFSSRQAFNQGQEAANHFNIGRKLYEDENRAFWDFDGSMSKLAKVTKVTKATKVPGWADRVKSSFSTPKKTPKEKRADEETADPATGEPLNGTKAAEDNTMTPTKCEGPVVTEKIDGKVGLLRTKATMWKKRWEEGDCEVAVLLLDPTIKEGLGYPLWRGYRNWSPIPSSKSADLAGLRKEACVPSLVKRRKVKEKQEKQASAEKQTETQRNTVQNGSPSQRQLTADDLPDPSFFQDFVYWAQRPEVVLGYKPTQPADAHLVPAVAICRLACSEWQTMSQYIKTRLSQIDWEITHPKEFVTQKEIDPILSKLHTWRRLVPQYREMLYETYTRVFKYPNHVPAPNTSGNAATASNNSTHPALETFRNEFKLVLSQLEEYEKRIDRLTTVVTSAISILDSRRVERLTYLAMLFVPLSLVGTLFSMSDDITEIKFTFGYWAAASTVCIIALYAWTLWTRKSKKTN